MVFEFLVPADAEPIDLLLKNIRITPDRMTPIPAVQASSPAPAGEAPDAGAATPETEPGAGQNRIRIDALDLPPTTRQRWRLAPIARGDARAVRGSIELGVVASRGRDVDRRGRDGCLSDDALVRRFSRRERRHGVHSPDRGRIDGDVPRRVVATATHKRRKRDSLAASSSPIRDGVGKRVR